ncbi:MAG: hypothetical protein IK066_11255 [Kiritimatiellae bacterium]|nr:hypothetical protein [Kiritimatiellia bacterium]
MTIPLSAAEQITAARYPDLLAVHRANDHAVMTAYGFDLKMPESDCVAELFKRYEALAGNQGGTGAAVRDANGGENRG